MVQLTELLKELPQKPQQCDPQVEDEPVAPFVAKGSHGGHSIWLPQEVKVRQDDDSDKQDRERSLRARKEEEERSIPGLMEALHKVDDTKLKGNSAFKRGDFITALKWYSEAVKALLQPPAAGTMHANTAATLLYCNIAAAHLKTENAEEAAASCSKALAMDKHCVKALFRRAEALRSMGKNAEALTDLEHARCLEPKNNTLLYALEDVEELLEEERFIERSTSGPSGNKSARDNAPVVQRVAEDAMRAHQEFVDGCMERLAADFKHTGAINACLVMDHTDSERGATGIGKIEIEGAFSSRAMLTSALEYARSQHATAFAKCACIIVRKSSILYPLVWWAGSWPFDIDQDGAFVELVLPGAAIMTRTWFMPLAGGGGHLEKAVELDIDCSIMYDLPSMFPH